MHRYTSSPRIGASNEEQQREAIRFLRIFNLTRAGGSLTVTHPDSLLEMAKNMTDDGSETDGYFQLLKDLQRRLKIEGPELGYFITSETKDSIDEIDERVTAIFCDIIGRNFMASHSFGDLSENDRSRLEGTITSLPILEDQLEGLVELIRKSYEQYSFSFFPDYIITKLKESEIGMKIDPKFTRHHLEVLSSTHYKVHSVIQGNELFYFQSDGTIDDEKSLPLKVKITSRYCNNNGQGTFESLTIEADSYFLDLVEAAVHDKKEGVEFYWKILNFRTLLFADFPRALESSLDEGKQALRSCIKEWIAIRRAFPKQLDLNQQLEIFSSGNRSAASTLENIDEYNKNLLTLSIVVEKVFNQFEQNYVTASLRGDVQTSLETFSLQNIIFPFQTFFEDATKHIKPQNIKDESSISSEADLLAEWIGQKEPTSINYILNKRFSELGDKLHDLEVFLKNIQVTISSNRTPKGSPSPELHRTEFFTRHIYLLIELSKNWLKEKKWSESKNRTELENVVYPYILSCINGLDPDALIHVIEEYFTYSVLKPDQYEENIKLKSFVLFVYYYKSLLVDNQRTAGNYSKLESYRTALIEKISAISRKRKGFREEFEEIERRALEEALRFASYEIMKQKQSSPYPKLYFACKVVQITHPFILKYPSNLALCDHYSSEKKNKDDLLENLFMEMNRDFFSVPSSLEGPIEIISFLQSDSDIQNFETGLDLWRENVHAILKDQNAHERWRPLLQSLGKLISETDHCLRMQKDLKTVSFLKKIRFELSLLLELTNCQINLGENNENDKHSAWLSLLGFEPYAKMLGINLSDHEDPLCMMRAVASRIPNGEKFISENEKELKTKIEAHPLVRTMSNTEDFDINSLSEELSELQINWLLYMIIPRLMGKLQGSENKAAQIEELKSLIFKLNRNHAEGELLLGLRLNSSSVKPKELLYISSLHSFLCDCLFSESSHIKSDELFCFQLLNELNKGNPKVGRLFVDSIVLATSDLSAAIQKEGKLSELFLCTAFNEAITFFKHFVLDSDDNSFEKIHLAIQSINHLDKLLVKNQLLKIDAASIDELKALALEKIHSADMSEWNLKNYLSLFFLLTDWNTPIKADLEAGAIRCLNEHSGSVERDVIEMITNGIINGILGEAWKKLLQSARQEARTSPG
ncbi:MAG: hypothetical protein KR126chlam1_01153 [Chlamydiae bacterium]|nr:hypothetical protein [Chlamydiota bacterium]